MAQPPATKTTKIVYEGWLIKSPPSKRVWRPKWRRRWFALRQSAELPGHYFLDYYSDRNSRKLKGTIDLELCEQIDAGLRMQRRSNEGTAVKGSVFSIRTQSRIYHLEADCVTEMEKWVDVICRVCGMKSMDDEKFYTRCGDTDLTAEHTETGPYIAISECITGPPKKQKQNSSLVFSFNQSQQQRFSNSSSLRENDKNSRSYVNTAKMFNNSNNFTRNVLRSSDQPPRLPENIYQNTENIAMSNVHTDSKKDAEHIEKGLARLSINDGSLPSTSMPPRPPKPSYLSLEVIHKESFVGPRIHEPHEVVNHITHRPSVMTGCIQVCHNGHRFGKNFTKPNYANTRYRFDAHGEEIPHSQAYLNLSTPPVVNRKLKPRRIRNNGSFVYEPDNLHSAEESSAKLQYLDLDLDSPSLNSIPSIKARREAESPTIYKTVDFLKTEALNMTRMDTEAYRRKDVPS